MKLTGYPSKLLSWNKKLMIDEYSLHIKAFINRSEMQEGKEGNYNSSRKKPQWFLLFCLASESKHSLGKLVCESLHTSKDILAPKLGIQLFLSDAT